MLLLSWLFLIYLLKYFHIFFHHIQSYFCVLYTQSTDFLFLFHQELLCMHILCSPSYVNHFLLFLCPAHSHFTVPPLLSGSGHPYSLPGFSTILHLKSFSVCGNHIPEFSGQSHRNIRTISAGIFCSQLIWRNLRIPFQDILPDLFDFLFHILIKNPKLLVVSH